nr:hypothetical protein [Tessaracoccus coleopterorum]
MQFPFGHGLSYTTFEHQVSRPVVSDGTVSVEVAVTNTGDAAGKDVVQVYFSAPTPTAASRSRPSSWRATRRPTSSPRERPRASPSRSPSATWPPTTWSVRRTCSRRAATTSRSAPTSTPSRRRSHTRCPPRSRSPRTRPPATASRTGSTTPTAT